MAEDKWKATGCGCKYGVAVYNFTPSTTLLYGLKLHIGDTVQILEECSEWYRGKLMKDRSLEGIFPKNCIKLKDANIINTGKYEDVSPVIEPVIEESTSVLREWGEIAKEQFLERRLQIFQVLKNTMNSLMDYRREIISGKLTKDQQSEIKEKITGKIDSVNRKLNLDLVPRMNGEIIEGDATSVVELYQVHLESSKRITKSRQKMKSGVPSGATVEKRMSMYGTLSKRPAVAKTPTAHHLFMSFKSFICNIGEAATLLFGLYDSTTGSYLSEKYIVKLTKHGMPLEIELLGKQFAIYHDLTNADLSKNIYMVCKIFRLGKLIDSKKVGNAEYRRPFGTGVYDITNILKGEFEDEKELYIPIFYAKNESEFYTLEDHIINKQTDKYSSFSSNANYSVCVDVKLFHGDIEKITKEKGVSAMTPRLGFPEVILPGYVRNDFYITLSKAEFEKGSKSAGKNIEVALCVVSDRGQVFNDCMSLGSGGKTVSEYRSFILYHSNSPHWNERIKVSLPIEQFHTAHLRFTFSHCSRNEGKVKGERIFAFAFIKLLKPDGTVTKDGAYELLLYKFDNSVDFFKVKTYLRLPASKQELYAQEKSGVVFAGPGRNPKESLSIRTYLCSTRLTQNSDIINFFQWRSLKEDEVLKALESFLKVSPEEIVKFLQDVFDALFKILSELQGDIGLAVFEAVATITKIVEEPKYAPFKSTLNSYIEEHFSATLVYRSLANSLCHVINSYSNHKSKSARLPDTIKSLTYIFKIIIRSYQLNFSASQNIEVFSEVKELMDNIFKSITNFMSTNSDSMYEIKGEVLKKLPDLCEDVLLVYSPKEYAVHITSIIEAVPKASNAFVHVQRLQCLRNVVESKLFIQNDSRNVLMKTIVILLSQFMERKQELTTCLELLGEVITALHHLDLVESDVSLLANNILSIELSVLLTIDRKSPMTGLSVACLLGILKLMDSDSHYEKYIKSHDHKNDLKDFMKKLIVAFKELLTIDTFPKDWFVLRTVGNNVILTAVQYFSKAFTDYFLKEEFFDQTLWENYFQLAVLFLTQPTLNLESFQQSKRMKVLERYGDMRQVMGFEILAMWEVLGAKKRYFIPGLIGPFLEMTLVPDLELRRATLPIFYDMMKVDFAENHDFKKVESELMEKMEYLMNNHKGDLEYEQLFQEIMVNKFQESNDPQFHSDGLKSIRSISELLRRLLDYRATTDSDSNNDVKMMCTYNLLEFYEEYSREDMYIKCIHKLVALHVICDNFTEAGYTLALHASLLDWVDTELLAFLKYPAQLEWQRKEQLYLEIIDYYDKGKTWEMGIQLCKELAQLYENKIVDYTKLSEILRKQAYFYDNIMKVLRPPPTYFRVSFYGRGFPHYLKDEVLIYRGLELESLAGFSNRIRSEFPSAEFLYKNTPPDQSIVQGIGQHIQICTVNPVPGDIDIIDIDGIHERIVSFYRTNEVNEFVFSRPVHKGEKDPLNEFKTLWLERTAQWTKRKFPNILKWSTIGSTKKTELTPLENATEMILTKNKELEKTVNDFSTSKKENINPLSMILNGIIDANVNGGIANYQSTNDVTQARGEIRHEFCTVLYPKWLDKPWLNDTFKAFLSDEFYFLNPEDKDKINHLKLLIHDQSSILSRGLQVHESYVTDALRPFHDKMVMMYSAMKVSIETGQPMENVLARPASLQTGSLHIPSGKKSPGKGNSPRDSPAESRRLINFGKSPSEGEIVPKSTKKGMSISASLQNILRRTSIQVNDSRSHHELKPSPLATPPPIPRRFDSDSSPMLSPASDIPSDVSSAALKRLGIQLTPSMAASAPNLVSIEEERPILPPKSKSKRHTTSGEGYNTSFESVFRTIDIGENNNNGLVVDSSQKASSSPMLPQVSSPDRIDEQELFDALDDMEHGFNSEESSSVNDEKDMDLLQGYSIDMKLDDFENGSSSVRPVPRPRSLVITEDTSKMAPPLLPARKSRSASQCSHQSVESKNEDVIEVDDSAPPPLPKKSVVRRTYSTEQ